MNEVFFHSYPVDSIGRGCQYIILTSTSNTVDRIRVKKYFSQPVRVDKLSRLDGQSCRVKNASHLFTKAKIRHEPHEGTSALQTVYASFVKQRSDINHARVIFILY